MRKGLWRKMAWMRFIKRESQDITQEVNQDYNER